MRVKTKYGHGTLLGISCVDNEDVIGYKVLLDNEFNSDLMEDEREFNEIKDVEKRICHCRSITALSDDGKEIIFFGNTITLKTKS